MASETVYFVVEYDNEATGPFVAKDATNLLTWDTAASSGFIVNLWDDGSTGKMAVALLTGTIPDNNDVLTQGATTADTSGPAPTGDAELMLYPAYFRDDAAVAASGALTWAGPALGATHSLLFEGQTGNVVAGEILTFSGGQSCECITVVSDAGATGELDVRWISFLDTLEFPDDNDTFTGDIIGDGNLHMMVHPRAYTPLNLHRLLGDLNDDEGPVGSDFLSMIDPDASGKDTDQIINLLGTVTITDEISTHMGAGSVSQASGATLYSGLDVNITDVGGLSEPLVIQDDTVVTAYWANAFLPNSIAGRVRILMKTRDEGVDIDGKRVKAKLLEFNDFYFEGQTTLGTGTTGLAVFSGPDGNNQTAVGTVAGAPYNTITQVEGYQLLDYNNGAGATPFGYSFGLGTATKLQIFERHKYIQRRGTAETLFGRDAQLATGVTMDFAYDAGAAFTEDAIVGWGQAEIVYSVEAVAQPILGEVVQFVGSGALGRIIHLIDDGTTGTMQFAMEGTTVPLATDTLLGVTSGFTADVDTVISNATFGTALIIGATGVATGNIYCQLLTGIIPADGQTIFQTTAITGDVNGAVNTRVINNTFVGVFTGSDYQTNFGIGIAVADGTANDDLRNLLNVVQEPPDNQNGSVANGNAGDYLMVNPWDGVTTDVNGFPEPTFAEMTLNTGLTGASTQVDVGTGLIPDNTPQAGWLRVVRDSDGESDRIEYDSHDNDAIFEIVGTAPSVATAGNNVMRSMIDKVWTTTGVPETYTAVRAGAAEQVAILLRRGGVTPIKPGRATATFGNAGFAAQVNRVLD